MERLSERSADDHLRSASYGGGRIWELYREEKHGHEDTDLPSSSSDEPESRLLPVGIVVFLFGGSNDECLRLGVHGKDHDMARENDVLAVRPARWGSLRLSLET